MTDLTLGLVYIPMDVVSVWYDLFDNYKMVFTSFDKISSLVGLQEDISIRMSLGWYDLVSISGGGLQGW